MPTDTLTVRSPAELICAVPYLLGFHPADSLAVVALRHGNVVFAARHDLPPPPDRAVADARHTADVAADARHTVDVDAEARHVAEVVARQDIDAAVIIGYGPATRVTPAVGRLSTALRAADVTVLDELRVTDGRYWSYACTDPACCPPEGVACDPAATPIAAAATFAGQVALPDRAALAAQVEPITGSAAEAVRAATITVERELTRRLVDLPSERAATGLLHRMGRAAVRAALRRYRSGGLLTDDETARLAVLLTHLPTRDFAWEHTGDQDWHLALWLDVLRRAPAGYAAAPACLLAFAAWRAGQGPLASVAVDRARRADPDYSMATLLDEVLRYGLPPSSVADWPRRLPHLPRPRRPRRTGRRFAR